LLEGALAKPGESHKGLRYLVAVVFWVGFVAYFFVDTQWRKYLDAVVLWVVGYYVWNVATKMLAEARDAIKETASDISEIRTLLVQINNRGAGTELQRLWDDEMRKKSLEMCRRATASTMPSDANE
jgi:hypothetical protein